MLKPFKKVIKRRFHPGIWIRFRTSSHQMQLHLKLKVLCTLSSLVQIKLLVWAWKQLVQIELLRDTDMARSWTYNLWIMKDKVRMSLMKEKLVITNTNTSVHTLLCNNNVLSYKKLRTLSSSPSLVTASSHCLQTLLSSAAFFNLYNSSFLITQLPVEFVFFLLYLSLTSFLLIRHTVFHPLVLTTPSCVWNLSIFLDLV